jgi:hypothetical protein
MNKLRLVHLYLGCAFAPLLAFFAISGVWQTFRLNDGSEDHGLSRILLLLSTLHKSQGVKVRGITNLSSEPFRWLVVAMAISLLVTMILGVVMAFRFGRARLALLSLAAGIVVPVGLIIARIYRVI